MTIHRIEANEINDWDKFHDYFYKEFNFPGYYGRNMNSWIDCMSDLNSDDQHVLHICDIANLKNSNIEIYEAIIECTAFVNWRYTNEDGQPILYLSFNL